MLVEWPSRRRSIERPRSAARRREPFRAGPRGRPAPADQHRPLGPWLALALCAGTSLLACGDDDGPGFRFSDAGTDATISFDSAVPPTPPPPPPPPGGDGAVPSCSVPLDVVFVLDVSTSMADEVEAIRVGLESIWDAAHALTTNTQLGMVVFVDDAVAVNDCAPFATVADMQGQFDRWRDFCATNASPASGAQNYDCAENSLDAIDLAASTCPWREGSTRVLVHVTDDTFAERPATLSDDGLGGGVAVQRTYDEVLSTLRAYQIRVGAFAAPGAGEECGAGASADVGQGFHTGYAGQPSLPEATGGRVWSIRDVRAGRLDMAEAINGLIADEYCTIF